jgi:hypothetical protein
MKDIGWKIKDVEEDMNIFIMAINTQVIIKMVRPMVKEYTLG